MSWFWAMQAIEAVPARYTAWNLTEPWQGLYAAMIMLSGLFCWSAFIFLDFRHVLTDGGNRSIGRTIVLITAGLPALAAVFGGHVILAMALCCAGEIARESIPAGLIAGGFLVFSVLLCLFCIFGAPMMNRSRT